ncbi:MAG: hypothetical protein V1900_03255 [Candidatus Aenigmatarchaeota archaeon]
MKYTAITLLILLVFAAGCIDGINFGADVIKVNKDEKKEVTNVIEIKDKILIPDSPLPPNAQATLSFLLENKDKLVEARNVRVSVFDPSVFTVAGPDECGYGCTILPGENKPVSFGVRAPSHDKIAGLITDLYLNYMVEYDFTSRTNYDTVIVTVDEIKMRQRAGEANNIKGQDIFGPGPIKIYVETDMPYVVSGMDYEPRFTFTLKNEGSGAPKDSTVKGMTVVFPSELVNPRPASDDYFSCSGNVCKSKKAITLYKGKSLPILFTAGVGKIGGPYKSAMIQATASYTYELRDSIPIKVKPLS